MSRKASGFRAWVIQRMSAMYLALGFIYLLVHFVVAPPADYAAWKAWLSGPLVNIGLSLLIHAWIGVRDVVIDYVHPFAIRLSVLTLVAVLLLGCGFWLLRSLVVVVI